VEGLPLNVDVSVGAVTFPTDGDEPEVLLRRADIAMYLAKGSGSGFACYDQHLAEIQPEMLALAGELRGALDRGEIVLYFQPQVNLATDEVPAVEVLIRWLHPTRGLIPPGEFIPLIQETSLVRPLTHYVLDQALERCREWMNQGHVLRVGVNLAMRNLIDDELPSDVASLLQRHRIPPTQLELEITETSVIAEPRRAEAVLARLSALGVRLSIDDFGTGYSSLTYLTRLPVEEVKIDRSFVTEMTSDTEKDKIVRSTIELASSLGKEVVAEGVESLEVMGQLKSYGCDLAQGFCVSHPLPAADFLAWLKQRSSN
jgi:EAL domain-containing protein (putative c-di-GMP-specific phosphodiesterase class I)